MNIQLELKKLIKNVLNDLDLEEDIIIEIPKIEVMVITQVM